MAFALEQLELLSPVRVLRRGYGIVSSPGGKVLRSVRQAKQGDMVEIMLADGRFSAKVMEIRKGAGK